MFQRRHASRQSFRLTAATGKDEKCLSNPPSRLPGTVPSPVPVLEVKDVVALIVGLVIGVGICKLPSLIAANAISETWMLV